MECKQKLRRDLKRLSRFRSALMRTWTVIREHDWHYRQARGEDDTESDSDEGDLYEKSRNELLVDLTQKVSNCHAYIESQIQKITKHEFETDTAKVEIVSILQYMTLNQGIYDPGSIDQRRRETYMNGIYDPFGTDSLVSKIIDAEVELEKAIHNSERRSRKRSRSGHASKSRGRYISKN